MIRYSRFLLYYYLDYHLVLYTKAPIPTAVSPLAYESVSTPGFLYKKMADTKVSAIFLPLLPLYQKAGSKHPYSLTKGIKAI